MRSLTFPQRLLLLAFFAFVAAGAALGQSDRGTIAGTILDSSAAPSPMRKSRPRVFETHSVYTTVSTRHGGGGHLNVW